MNVGVLLLMVVVDVCLLVDGDRGVCVGCSGCVCRLLLLKPAVLRNDVYGIYT